MKAVSPLPEQGKLLFHSKPPCYHSQISGSRGTTWKKTEPLLLGTLLKVAEVMKGKERAAERGVGKAWLATVLSLSARGGSDSPIM